MSQDIQEIINLTYKYGDFKTAFDLIEQPDYYYLKPKVFSDWIRQMIRESKSSDMEIEKRIKENY